MCFSSVVMASAGLLIGLSLGAAHAAGDDAPAPAAVRHVGSAAESVVHVTVSLRDPATGRTEQCEGSGVLIRCDGYVLVPTALMANGKGWGLSGQVRSNEVRFVARKAPEPTPRPQEVPVIPFFNEKRGYAVAKLQDVHALCQPLLHASNIRKGMRVEVVFARRDPSRPDVAVAETVEAVVGEQSGDRPVWTFAREGLPKVLPGAVVVDKASGLAIGIVPGTQKLGEAAAPAPGFVDFTDLYHNTNSVGLVPHPAKYTREEQQPEPGEKRNGMIWIPGGEVEMPKRAETSERVRKRIEDVQACTPGFWIDECPVTNNQYERFLEATRYKPRPYGWDEMDRAEYRRLPDLPVQGVRHEDAAAYAEWAGKRLVTPAEWERASLGGMKGEMSESYPASRNVAGLRMRLAYRELGIESAEAIQQKIDHLVRSTRLPPPVRLKEGFIGVEAAGTEFAEFIAPVERHFGYPGLILPVGTRESDRSDFGVLDVSMNPDERLLRNLSDLPVGVKKQIFPGSTRLREDIFPNWRSILIVHYIWVPLRRGTIVGGDGLPIHWGTSRSVYSNAPRTETPPQTWRGVFGRDQHHPFLPIWIPGSALEAFIFGQTFRCAR